MPGSLTPPNHIYFQGPIDSPNRPDLTIVPSKLVICQYGNTISCYMVK